MDKRTQPLVKPDRPTEDVVGVIWGQDQSPYATQAITDDTFRERATNRAVPCDMCVKEAKDWVDFNEK